MRRSRSISSCPPSAAWCPTGTGPWDARPGSTMTNACVAEDMRASRRTGETLTVKYKDGEKKVHSFTPETADRRLPRRADRSELKPGARDHHHIGWASRRDGSVPGPRHRYVGRGRHRRRCDAGVARFSKRRCPQMLRRTKAVARRGPAMIRRVAFGVLCGSAFGTIAASAQDQPVRVAGTVEKLRRPGAGGEGVRRLRRDGRKLDRTADATGGRRGQGGDRRRQARLLYRCRRDAAAGRQLEAPFRRTVIAGCSAAPARATVHMISGRKAP